MPSAFKSFAPILIPLILIAFSSFISYPSILEKVGGKETTLYMIATFLGSPVIALAIGVILCFFLAPLSSEVTNKWVGEGVKEGGNIIMITAAGGALGAVLATLAIGSGAMVVSHANDSYFWVVTQFSDMDLSTAYKAQTMATLVEGVVGVLVVYGLSIYML